MSIKIGADPEVFVANRQSVVSAGGMVQGTKAKPLQVYLGALQVDGMALEFNIDPAEDVYSFVHNNLTVMHELTKAIPSDHELVIKPTHLFNEDYLKSQPDEVKELGCDPDYNAYTGEANPRPDESVSMRTTAGHIHIGFMDHDVDPFDPVHISDCEMLVKELDLSLTYAYMYNFKDDMNRERMRRTMYGQAGSYRPKPYGVEYRVPSNTWLKSPERMAFVYKKTMETVDRLFSSRPLLNTEEKQARIRDRINNASF